MVDEILLKIQTLDNKTETSTNNLNIKQSSDCKDKNQAQDLNSYFHLCNFQNISENKLKT